MSISKKALSIALALSVAPVMTIQPVQASQEAASLGGLVTLFAFLMTTTIVWSTTQYDAHKAQSLLDEAAAGQGEKLELLATASGKSVEVVADTIMRFEKEGLISAEQPEAMAKTLAAELSK